MRRSILGAVALATVAAAAPVARADHATYAGPGCRFVTANDTTPGGQLGGQDQWNGEISILAAAADAAGTPKPAWRIDVTCELLVDGASQGEMLAATGIGVVAAAAVPFAFVADETDVVTLCTHATVDGHPTSTCHDLTARQLVPSELVDVINALIELLIEILWADPGDPTCLILGELPPGAPGIVDITPEGDVYVLTVFIFDCPPYEEG
jgi:hypothetical protein